MTNLRLSKWAKLNGYSYQGAYEMYARGQLPNAIKLPSGSIIVQQPDAEVKKEKTGFYWLESGMYSIDGEAITVPQQEN